MTAGPKPNPPLTPERIRELCLDFESEQVERTRAFDKADKIGQAICAFANDLPDTRRPGYLLLGVENDGTISGRRISDEKWASLGGLKTDGNLLPPPAISMTKASFPEGDVVAVQVFPSDYPPIRYNGDVWIRVGPRRAIATDEDVHVLEERRAAGGERFEERPCTSAEAGDLDMDLFRTSYLPLAVDALVIERDDRAPLDQMKALRFFSRESDRPTNLGMILFGKHPELFVPPAYVQYVKFAGSGNAAPVENQHAFRGPLARVISELDGFIKAGVSRKTLVRVSALREREAVRYPSWSLRELLLNAIVHRDYSFGNAPIKFYEYDDRIEIANPGGLFGRANPGNFPFVSDYRNPLLAEAMKVLGFVNRFNRGIATVRDELAQNGNPPAVFDVNKRTEFRVTVRAAAESGAINPESGAINPESGAINPESGTINGGIKPKSGGIKPKSGGINPESGGINPESGGINPHHPEELDSAIFNLIGQQSGIKRDGIFLIVKTSLRSVERSLARLRDAGKIEYRGSKRTGGWFVRT